MPNAGPFRPTEQAVQITDRGLEVGDGTNSRVQIGDISSAKDKSSYGLKVVSSDGSTVIIDGTSDIFKIAASGTFSHTIGAGLLNDVTTTTLSGLGALATTPAHLSFLSDVNTTSGRRILGMGVTQGQLFAASTSGGSPTVRFTSLHEVDRVATYLDGSSFCVVEAKGSNSDVAAFTWFWRYYVLQETAL